MKGAIVNDRREPAKLELHRERGYRFRVRFDDPRLRDLVTDEPRPLGVGSGPNPIELLGAAVGDCLASSLLFCLERARIPVGGLEAEVEVHTARNERGRLRIERIDVRLEPAVPDALRTKMTDCLERFESFCTVTESVRQGIEVRVAVAPQGTATLAGPWELSGDGSVAPTSRSSAAREGSMS